MRLPQGMGMTSARTRERLVRRLREKGIREAVVLEAIRDIPRHLFVDEALASRAYEDTALPIGHGQTISQPFVVARMTEALLGGGVLGDVLEIGTGCGYQTAILARIARRVYTIERVAALLHQARARLQQLRLRNVHFVHGDGMAGLPQRAPFGGILVTAAPMEVPETLLEQLASGGRMVIPVGRPGAQELLQVTRLVRGYQRMRLGRVSFVPLVDGAVS